jgi:hypothetical protein
MTKTKARTTTTTTEASIAAYLFAVEVSAGAYEGDCGEILDALGLDEG